MERKVLLAVEARFLRRRARKGSGRLLIRTNWDEGGFVPGDLRP